MEVPIYRLDHYSLPQPQNLPAATVELEITRGRVQHRLRPVRSKVFLIGAASDCDLVLGDLQFPEAYAYLFVNGSEVSIRRLGSGPELRVGGVPTESAELFHGDRLAFGPFELQVRVAASRQREPSPGEHTAQFETAELDTAELDTAELDAVELDKVETLLLDIRRGLAAERSDFPLPLPRTVPASA